MAVHRDLRIRARAARGAALVVAAASVAACTSERLSTSEGLTLASQPSSGGERTVVTDESGCRQPTTRLDVRPLISAQLPLQRSREAFELALDKTRSTKVQVVAEA